MFGALAEEVHAEVLILLHNLLLCKENNVMMSGTARSPHTTYFCFPAA